MHRAARWIVISSLVLLPAAVAADEESPVVIEDGRTVSLEYTITLEDGTTADTNVGGEPLKFEQGKSQILPALERELAGLEVGATKKVSLEPEEGYGPVQSEAFQKVDPSMIPEASRKEGARLLAQDGSGNKRVARVHEVADEHIVIDLNHPLAGKKLDFEVRVLAIE